MLRRALFIPWTLSFCTMASHAQSLEFSVIYANSEHRTNFTDVINQFEERTGISVDIRFIKDDVYKKKFKDWLTGENPPDVIQWQGGERLLSYVRQGLVLPLDELWAKQEWNKAFSPAVKAAVSWNNQTFALPYSYYHWGFYYSKQIFREAKLNLPTTWEQLVQSCSILRQQGVIPIILGNRGNWPALAWFDYLDLRLNGLAFHQQLTRGEIPYTDPRVKAVFEHWKELIDARCFNENIDQLDWRSSLPYVYHRKAAIVLMASFIIPFIRGNDIEIAPFPTINPDLPRYEDSPLDLFIIPANGDPSRRENAKRLLAFLGEASTQQSLHEGLATFSPHRAVTQQSTANMLRANIVLSQSHGYAQFFDRDVLPEFEKEASPLIANFPMEPHVSIITTKLESLRKQFYSDKN